MPIAPPRICPRHRMSYAGARCPECAAMYQQKWEAAKADNRPGARQRGYTRTWQRVRELKMHSDPICESCMEHGALHPAVLVHHIDGNPRNNAMENLRSLCKPCHTREHQDDRKAFFPVVFPASAIPLTIICGPPASGKSTWVNRVARDGDTVIDLDVIKARIAGVPIYHAPDVFVKLAIIERNKMLIGLRDARNGQAFFILSGAGHSVRKKWRLQLGAQRVVVFDCPPFTCISRIMADARRPEPLKQRHKSVVARWWKAYVASAGDELMGCGAG